MFRIIAGLTSLLQNLKLYNFITSWKLIKMPQNFVHFGIELTKIRHKNRIEVLPSVLFKANYFAVGRGKKLICGVFLKAEMILSCVSEEFCIIYFQIIFFTIF